MKAAFLLAAFEAACTLGNPCAAISIVSAREPQLPAGVSCADVRAQVAEHGYAKAVIWAREHGYSWRQILEAKRCLR